MKVFLSWSGKKSREIATCFHDWLPYVIQSAKPFISTGDIDKGRRWSEVLASELSEAAYGIICITQANFKESWLNFEAGAISKAIDVSYVSPFLFDVEPARIQGPLQQFQFTVNDKEDIFNLIRSINNRLNADQKLSYEILRQEFDLWWPKLKAKFDAIAKIPESDTETGYDWLYTIDDLAKIQADDSCKCVWFITPNLYRNALTPKMREVIRMNTEREVSYKFIIPASDEMMIAKEAVERLAALKPGHINITDISPAEEFRRLAVTDYLILNADSDAVQVFLELPTSTHGYWIKVEAEAALGFVMRFRALAGQATYPESDSVKNRPDALGLTSIGKRAKK